MTNPLYSMRAAAFGSDFWTSQLMLDPDFDDADDHILFSHLPLEPHPDAWHHIVIETRRPRRPLRGELESTYNPPRLPRKRWPTYQPKKAKPKEKDKPRYVPTVAASELLRFWSSTNSPLAGKKPSWWDDVLPGIEPTGGWAKD